MLLKKFESALEGDKEIVLVDMDGVIFDYKKK